jgi:hypothetical protein
MLYQSLVAEGVEQVELRLKKPHYRAEPVVFVAVVSAGSAAISALVAGIFKVLESRSQRIASKIVYRVATVVSSRCLAICQSRKSITLTVDRRPESISYSDREAVGILSRARLNRYLSKLFLLRGCFAFVK